MTESIDFAVEGGPSQEELIRAAQANPARFADIYDCWSAAIYRYFYARTVDTASAEDLTSQLFLAAYQAFPRYHHRGHFPAWLFTIARNLFRDYSRKNSRETSLDEAQFAAARSDPPQEAAQAEEIECLRRLVAQLPEREQELIRLRYTAELSFSEMAVILKRREDAVKKSLYRLQARLQRLLEEDHV